MRKSTINRIRRLVAVILIVLMGIETSAAVVGSYDGGAFVTKEEFENLKTNFNSQIDKYNASLDNKIGGAINNYLLALIKPTIELTNLTLKHPTRTFVNDFTLSNTNRLGDYVEGYASIVISGCNNDSTYTNAHANSTRMVLVEFNTNGGTPTLQTRGTNKDTFVLLADSTWNKNYLTCIRQVQSVPYSAWGGAYYHHGNPPARFEYAYPAPFTITYDGATWGAEDKPITLTSIPYSTEVYHCAAQAFALNMDTDLTEANFSNLAGGKVSESLLYTLHVNDTEFKGATSSNIELNGGWFRIRYGGRDYSEGDHWPRGRGYYMQTYHHKYEHVYKLSDFIIDSLSATIKEPVRYYSGLPLFRASQDGEVELNIKFVNDGNETSKVAISNQAFKNVDLTPGVQLDEGAVWSVNGSTTWPNNFSSNTNYKFRFDVKKDKVYYIKVLPATSNHNTKVEIVGDIKNMPL